MKIEPIRAADLLDETRAKRDVFLRAIQDTAKDQTCRKAAGVNDRTVDFVNTSSCEKNKNFKKDFEAYTPEFLKLAQEDINAARQIRPADGLSEAAVDDVMTPREIVDYLYVAAHYYEIEEANLNDQLDVDRSIAIRERLDFCSEMKLRLRDLANLYNKENLRFSGKPQIA